MSDRSISLELRPAASADALDANFSGKPGPVLRAWRSAALLDRDGFFSGRALGGSTPPGRSLESPLALCQPFPAKAKRCIFLFMYGGPSQMDLFDYKPELQKRHGQTVNVEVRRGLDRKANADGLEAAICPSRPIGPMVLRLRSRAWRSKWTSSRSIKSLHEGFVRARARP